MPKNNVQADGNGPPGQPARARLLVPALVFFLAGVALSALWFARAGARHSSDPSSAAGNSVALSDATKAVLQHLESPVEIRFYSMLDASSVPDSVQAYAGRADQLLAQYEQVAGNKLRVIRCNSLGNPGANAAEADGISAFNLDKGDACFLGVAVACGSQIESLPRLAPEWEQALESDLTHAITRAIARAAGANPGEPAPARIAPATLAEVKRSIPNLEAVSLDAGTKVLRDAALTQFQQAAAEMQAQVQEAEQRFLAQGDQSEAAQRGAAEQLRKIQAEGAAKLQHIALNSHAQIAALQQLKKSGP